MDEFDLDSTMEYAAGFGWEAHFRQRPVGPQVQGMPIMNLLTETSAQQDVTYACDPTATAGSGTCETCYTTCTGLTGRPCAC
jgi:hypothetical protein